MKKVLVIAHNETKAQDGENLIKAADNSLIIKKVFAGAKRVPRHFDAVIIYHTLPNEINFIKDEIQRYNEAPIKSFISKAGSPIYPDAASYKA